MKAASFYLTSIIAIAALALSAMLFSAGKAASELQEKVAAQNRTIQRGASAGQIHKNLLGDLARLSLEHPKIKDLLDRNGYHVERRPRPAAQAQANPEATPEPSPQAAAEATPQAQATPRSSRNRNSSNRSR